MADREKLIELLEEIGVAFPISKANFLIANGVTIQKWIPVTERLPEIDVWVLVCCVGEWVSIMEYSGRDWEDGDGWRFEMGVITHWMPLPEPPKGE